MIMVLTCDEVGFSSFIQAFAQCALVVGMLESRCSAANVVLVAEFVKIRTNRLFVVLNHRIENIRT